MKKLIVFSIIISLFSVFSFGEGMSEVDKAKLMEWEKKAGLGDFRPATDNWAEIEAKAKAEKEVVIWANTSRIFDAIRGYSKKYAGIKVVPNDIGAGSIFEKLRREQESDLYTVDVILVSDIPTLYNEFLTVKAVYKFLPKELEPLMWDQNAKLGIQRYGGKMVAYNSQTYKKAPVDTWWDLTRPEWKSKVIMKDPMKGGSDINLMASFVQHTDEMAAIYKEEFGETIKLNGTQNAGYEFIKRLLQNDLVLMSGGSPVADAVGAPNQAKPPLGILSPSKQRLAGEKEIYLDMVRGMRPFENFLTSQTLSIARFAPHPYAAKLLIKWLHGDSKGGEGYAPFHAEGTWSPRKDVPEPPGQAPFNKMNLWREDAEWLYNNIVEFKDFWTQIQ